jgi:hypothetical protein
VGRSLRDLYAGRGRITSLALPLVGIIMFRPTGGSRKIVVARRYTGHEVTAPRAVGPSGRRWSLRGLVEGAFGGEREHEPGEAAEDHADADERADDPDCAGRPGTPDHDGEDEGDDAIEQEPVCAVTGAELEGLDGFNYALEEEIDGKDEGEGDESVERVQEQIDAGEEVDGSDEYLP